MTMSTYNAPDASFSHLKNKEKIKIKEIDY